MRENVVTPARDPGFVAGRDLRMRYTPRARIRPIYLHVAPWLDLLFVLFFLVLVQSRLVLKPGVLVDLPAYHVEGIQGGHVAVLIRGRGRFESPATLYFADEVFRLDHADRTAALAATLARIRLADQETLLTLYADSAIAQVFVIQVMELASQAGYAQLNLGTAPAVPMIP
jgi:biopolymer transport protein ExbD